MLLNIYYIKKIVDKLLITTDQTYNHSTLQQECEDFKLIIHDYSIRTKLGSQEPLFAVYYNEIRAIADQLYLDNQQDPQFVEPLNLLIDLLTYIETIAGAYLDQSCILSAFQQEQEIAKNICLFKEIETLLESKNSRSILIKPLLHALEVLQTSKNLSLNNQQYIDTILKHLNLLASNIEINQLDHRIRQLLIQYNGAHYALYELIEQDIHTQILSPRKINEQLKQLYFLQLEIEQIQPAQPSFYNPNNQSIKQMLLTQIMLLKEYLEKIEDSSPNSTENKLHFNLGVSELSLLFHYQFYDGFYNYNSKKDAATAFCEHIQSKETLDISVHSLQKHDKLQLKNAAIKMHQRLSRVLKNLSNDFDI